MSGSLFERTPLDEAFTALRNDVLSKTGPRISTMRNYRFAILQYQPADEFKLRAKVRRLSSELIAGGWALKTIDLEQLLIDRIRRQDVAHPRFIERIVAMEKRLGGERGLAYLSDKLVPLLEEPDGLATDCAEAIRTYVERHQEKAEKTLVLIGRVGSMYPFLRPSILIKHLDGRTNNVPVVLLYPGERRGDTGLSFMGELDPLSDYRPRIYP